MPELPEVHGYQQYINATCLHQRITKLDCRDNRLLKMHPDTFERHLLGQEFTGSQRIGKYLFLETSGDRVVVMHFGMTGRPNYYKDEEARPKFAHVQFAFDNGYYFGFENKRKFGWLDLTTSVREFQKAHNLSDDARKLSWEDFKTSFDKRSTYIKPIIMDQSVAAGVGNWMADEILYQARIHPEKKVGDMDEEDLRKVFDAMKKVIETAIEHDAHYADFPEDFMMHFRKSDGTCYHTGDPIEKIKVGGRTTYVSPGWQEK